MSENLFERFVSVENFKLAWERIKRSDRLEVKERLWLDIFNAQIDKHIEYIINSIENNRYQPQRPEYIYRVKTRETLRPFAYLTMTDRLVYQACGNVLAEVTYPSLDRYFDKNVFAHVPQPPDKNGKQSPFMFLPSNPKSFHKGQYQKFSDSLNETRKILGENGNWWEIKTDISTYYHSISHNLLLSQLENHGWLSKDRFSNLIFRCLSKWSISQTGSYQTGIGLPLGYETSDYLGTLFLYEIDKAYATGFYYHRFVDDIHIFVEGSEQDAYFQLSQLDIAIQRLGVLLNSSKTSVELCKMTPKYSRVSMIMLDGTRRGMPEYEILLEQLNRITLEFETECDVNAIINHQSDLAFIFYRIELKSESLRNLALCVLQYAPRMSYQLTSYLALYKGDSTVINELFSLASNTLISGQVRYDCVVALFEIMPPSADIVELVTYHVILNTNDWFLRYSILGLLKEKPELKTFLHIETLRVIWREATNQYTKGISLILALEKSNDAIASEIINTAISSENEEMIFLGFYSIRRKTHLKREQLILTKLEPKYHVFHLSEEEKNHEIEFKTFFRNHQLEVSPELNSRNLLSGESSHQFYQATLDAKDSYPTNPQKYLKAVTTIVNLFLNEYSDVFSIQSNGHTFEQVTSSDPLIQVFLDVYFNLFSKLQSGKVLLNPDVRSMKRTTSKIMTVIIYRLSKLIDIPIDIELEQKYSEIIKMRNQVFISYSHSNKFWQEKVKKHLTVSFRNHDINIWDDTQIDTGDKWHDEIQRQLQKSRVVILLVTPDFLLSNYIVNHELMPTIKAVQENGVKLYWIAVSYTDYGNYGLLERQCYNDPNIPLNDERISVSEADRLLTDMAMEIRDKYFLNLT